MRIAEITTFSVTPNTSDASLSQIIAGIIYNFVLPAFGAIALIGVVYAGVLYIMSQGEPEKVQKAHKALLYSIVAIVLVGLSWGIVKGLNSILSNEILK